MTDSARRSNSTCGVCRPDSQHTHHGLIVEAFRSTRMSRRHPKAFKESSRLLVCLERTESARYRTLFLSLDENVVAHARHGKYMESGYCLANATMSKDRSTCRLSGTRCIDPPIRRTAPDYRPQQIKYRAALVASWSLSQKHTAKACIPYLRTSTAFQTRQIRMFSCHPQSSYAAESVHLTTFFLSSQLSASDFCW